MFFTEASERRHAEANEDEIRVHQTGKHLREIGSNIPPPDSCSPENMNYCVLSDCETIVH